MAPKERSVSLLWGNSLPVSLLSGKSTSITVVREVYQNHCCEGSLPESLLGGNSLPVSLLWGKSTGITVGREQSTRITVVREVYRSTGITVVREVYRYHRCKRTVYRYHCCEGSLPVLLLGGNRLLESLLGGNSLPVSLLQGNSLPVSLLRGNRLACGTHRTAAQGVEAKIFPYGSSFGWRAGTGATPPSRPLRRAPQWN